MDNEMQLLATLFLTSVLFEVMLVRIKFKIKPDGKLYLVEQKLQLEQK